MKHKKGYHPEDNYCTLSPDKVCGVRINFGCYLHDRQYRNEVKNRLSRKSADVLLRNRIQKSFNIAGKPRRGWLVSWIYYYGVRVMGIFTWVREK